MKPCVLLKFGELALKGRNRSRFVAKLRSNLRQALPPDAQIGQRAGALVVTSPDDAHELLERARDVIGVSVLHPALVIDKSPEAAAETAVALLRDKPAETFAIRARRRDKRFPLSSRELATLAGQAVRDALPLRVNLDEPDAEVHLEVDEREIFAYTEKIRGRGGLPVGISGSAVVLLSGGIDSPVAAYRAMRRGLHCEFVHFTGEPFTGPESTYKAYAHVKGLDRFQGDSRLFVVPFGRAQRELASAGAGRLQVMAQRRLMVRVAAAIAARGRSGALVTGDSLGQVASQTLPNLAAVDDASGLPILRPLIGLDKAEIVDQAKELGSFDVSKLPDEDCCQLFSSRQAETRADVDTLRKLERVVDVEALVERLAADARPVRPGEKEPEGAEDRRPAVPQPV